MSQNGYFHICRNVLRACIMCSKCMVYLSARVILLFVLVVHSKCRNAHLLVLGFHAGCRANVPSSGRKCPQHHMVQCVKFGSALVVKRCCCRQAGCAHVTWPDIRPRRKSLVCHQNPLRNALLKRVHLLLSPSRVPHVRSGLLTAIAVP